MKSWLSMIDHLESDL